MTVHFSSEELSGGRRKAVATELTDRGRVIFRNHP